MEIGSTTSNPFAELGLARKPEPAATRELGQQDFLQLMLAQIQNQNPLEPQANGEFLGQLAQFGIVEGVQDLNSGFGDLSDRLAGEQTLAAASLLGRDVLVPGDRQISDSGVAGVVELPAPTREVQLDILDSRGQTVRSLRLDGSAGGELPFVWDGRDAEGNVLPADEYRVVASASNGNENTVLPTLIAASVSAVSRQGNDVQLELDGLPQASISEIRRIA